MRKLTVIAFLGIALATTITVQSCKTDSPTITPNEVVADNSTFANFESWTLEATNHGPSPSLGAAHSGNDTSVTRKIYFKDGQARVNGTYPIGTVIVKRSTNPAATVDEIVGMVKRGNSFNPTTGDWEWFMLMPDGTIATDGSGMAMRGGVSMMGGMCNACHSGASATDFTFSK
ncbi:MAG: cytochrome P460 family protein [bacterium]|nr:cytochrome P460 family protein [bacterium]